LSWVDKGAVVARLGLGWLSQGVLMAEFCFLSWASKRAVVAQLMAQSEGFDGWVVFEAQ
jgi:hypothetical protein